MPKKKYNINMKIKKACSSPCCMMKPKPKKKKSCNKCKKNKNLKKKCCGKH